MQRYFIELQYKGTNYSGWQLQHNAISVQEKLNEGLSLYLGENITTIGCGRTDTGVHALQFFAQFDSAKKNDAQHFCYHVNGILSNDICILNLYEVDADVNARFDATSRSYIYVIYQNKNPFIKELASFYPKKIDLNLMNESCEILKSFSDFECFSKVHTQVKTFVCHITHAQWKTKNNLVLFEIRADRFLRGMVRAIVGTMLLVGEKQISLEQFKSIIENKDRKQAGHSVHANGLYLSEVCYPFIKPVKRNIFDLNL
jgi:tRNA pseudouridine38-40 synthase